MKKYLIIALTSVISLVCLFVVDNIVDKVVRHELETNIDKAKYYNNIYTRNCSDYVMERIIDDHSIVVFGSSELSSRDNLAFPSVLFNGGYADFNMVLMGAGHLQSLAHAINVGALQNNIKNRKIVLILSPQWFVPEGVIPAAFSSRFEETNFVEFLQNDCISLKTKTAVIDRVNALLTADIATLERVKNYEKIYLEHTINPITYAAMLIYNAFQNAKIRFKLVEEFKNLAPLDTSRYVHAEEIDFDVLLQKADKIGQNACLTNAFGVNDEYYNKYIRDKVDIMINVDEKSSYALSPEYEDLKLFLSVCRDTGITPLLISVPVNGRWYDYTGFSRSDRHTYYQNIRNICDEFHVQLVDFSDKEYELFFLRDIMHIGWKGWVYLCRSVYSFYKGEDISDITTYQDMINTDNTVFTDGVNRVGWQVYTFSTNIEGNKFNQLIVHLAHDKTLLDSSNSVGKRSGVYLHTQPSGHYTIRFRANSNLLDEYISIDVYLEKNSVYRFSYSIDNFSPKSLHISGLSISKVKY